jgi:hypothetical protein
VAIKATAKAATTVSLFTIHLLYEQGRTLVASDGRVKREHAYHEYCFYPVRHPSVLLLKASEYIIPEDLLLGSSQKGFCKEVSTRELTRGLPLPPKSPATSGEGLQSEP